jgi:hypothetical protein
MHMTALTSDVDPNAKTDPRQIPLIDARRLLESCAALLAVCGGVVHLAQVRHHLSYPTVVAAFAVMGAAQVMLASLLVWRPSRRLPWVGIAVHAAITSAWVLSRTVGLGFVDGVSDPQDVGIADAVATAISVAVMAVSARLILMSHRRVQPGLVPVGVARVLMAAVGAVTLASAIPASWAGHDHDHTSGPAPSVVGPGQHGDDARPHQHADGADEGHGHG